MKAGDLVSLRMHYPASVFTHKKGLEQIIISKGTTGLVISCEVRGPVPGVNVLFSTEENVRWCPVEVLKEVNS